jgi:hypothetical protein
MLLKYRHTAFQNRTKQNILSHSNGSNVVRETALVTIGTGKELFPSVMNLLKTYYWLVTAMERITRTLWHYERIFHCRKR